MSSERFGCRMVSVGAYLPERVMPVAEAAARYDVDPDWVSKRTHVVERRFAADEETLSSISTRASQIAIERAGIDPEEIDLVLCATSTAEFQTPGSAPVIQHALGATNAGALDVGAACAGWLGSVALGAAMVEAGRAETVLVVGAEIVSRLLGKDPGVGLLMGDGAGAVILRRSEPGDAAIGPTVIHSEGQYARLVIIDPAEPEDGRRVLRMSGQETYTIAVKTLVAITREVLEMGGLEMSDIDLFVYHQANGRILRAVADRLQLPAEKTVSVVERTGNTSAASIPLALDAAYADGRLVPGQKVLLASIGAGFVSAAAIVDWG
jgi:3-oxoacyl-[acyl-carrier-protein] synthase-3